MGNIENKSNLKLGTLMFLGEEFIESKNLMEENVELAENNLEFLIRNSELVAQNKELEKRLRYLMELIKKDVQKMFEFLSEKPEKQNAN